MTSFQIDASGSLLTVPPPAGLQYFQGFPKGVFLSLFCSDLLYVNGILECIPCSSDMFANDTLLHNSAPVNEVSFPIQAGLLCMSNWCRQWLLKVCEAKCKCMRITRSKVNGQCSYSINSLPLKQVVTHKHLGVTFSSDLSSKDHVLTIAAKANKILGLLKRTFGRCSEAIITGYKTMVRPIIEYVCPVGIHIKPTCQTKLKESKEMSHAGSLVDLLIIPNVCNTLVGWNLSPVGNFYR